ncbi:MAG: hypothetical protein GC160_00640 [Acidobacteria bacterium]|nr:hypothetical protein [Acidobacteriota bacterium]
MVIKSVGVLSLAKMLGAVYGAIGLIGGLIVSLIAMFGGFAAAQSDMGAGGAMMGGMLGVGAVILFPLLYGAMGFIGGALTAVIYNVFAGIAGGIEIHVQQSPGAGASSFSTSA